MASSTESDATGLVAKGLDLFSVTMGAIPNQGMNVSICDSEVRALVVGAGETLSIYPFRSTSPAFDLAPGAHRKRGRSHTRREGGGEAVGRTIKWSARLEETLDFGVDGSYS
jgi:hypothetical protein